MTTALKAAAPRGRSNRLRNGTRQIIWARGAGRCHMCNVDLIGDLVSGAEDANFGFIAHIVADAPDGPRGDAELSHLLADDPGNLMLLCHVHHKAIDVELVDEYPVERLLRIKADHERRVSIRTGVLPERASHVVRYAANVGQHRRTMPYQEIARAMMPDRHPANGRETIDLSLHGSVIEDDEQAYWALEAANLRRQMSHRVSERIEVGEIDHMSVFAFAPQPLLILLGSLLGDITPADVYQLHREPAGWAWPEGGSEMPLVATSPAVLGKGPVALKIALSADVNDARVRAVLGDDVDIWTMTTPKPNNDVLKRKEDLSAFRTELRLLLNRIKADRPDADVINILPAMPVSAAVEVGRAWMPKADLPLDVWDENRKIGGFGRALRIDGALG